MAIAGLALLLWTTRSPIAGDRKNAESGDSWMRVVLERGAAASAAASYAQRLMVVVAPRAGCCKMR